MYVYNPQKKKKKKKALVLDFLREIVKNFLPKKQME